jgi:predicted RNA-binding protein Jag
MNANENPKARGIQFRIGALMILVVFAALSLSVVILSVELHRSKQRETVYRLREREARAVADQQRAVAEQRLATARAAVDQMLSQIAEIESQPRGESAKTGK